MKILFTGRGTSGSWQIRGAQMADALGALAVPKVTDAKGMDVVVLVKRPHAGQLGPLRASSKRLVWDIVDAWPQPEGNTWSRSECLAWLRAQLRAVRPDALIAATRQMVEDCKEFGLPVAYVPHHCRPTLAHNSIRGAVHAVGYEGSEAYLGKWRRVLEKECKKRGWAFVVNPAHLADVDIVVAMREATGYGPRNWKSNVKLANAQGSGTPFVGNREAGYVEQAVPGCERWADTEEELCTAFSSLLPQKERGRVSSWMLAVAPRLSKVSGQMLRWLQEIESGEHRVFA